MRTIMTLILSIGLALGVTLMACAEKTPPPRTAESEAREAPAAMAPTPAEPKAEGGTEARPAPEKGAPATTPAEMAPPKPEGMDTGATDTP